MIVTLGYHKAMNGDLDYLQKVYERLGVEVHRLASDTTDAVFHRDVFSWTPWGLIQCAMGKESRRWEPKRWFEQMSTRDPMPAFLWRDGGTFEGADLMWSMGPVQQRPVGILASGKRTNKRGADEVGGVLETMGATIYRVVLPEYHDQHLLGVANMVTHGLFAYDGELLLHSRNGRFGMPAIRLPKDEYTMKGSNWVQVGDAVVLNAKCRSTIRLLEQYCRPIAVPIESLLAHGGGVACATGVVQP